MEGRVCKKETEEFFYLFFFFFPDSLLCEFESTLFHYLVTPSHYIQLVSFSCA